jgi:predicted DNA-binding protein (UPF0251 family)
MPRTEKDRLVHTPPLFSEFKPIGVPVQQLQQVTLTLDEFEAFRLADYQGFTHAEGALEMGISRSTFSRLIEKSRKKIADYIIEGRLLSIEGGNVHFSHNIIQCQKCGHMFKTNIHKDIHECPHCHSNKLINLAGGFGHGKCCRKK